MNGPILPKNLTYAIFLIAFVGIVAVGVIGMVFCALPTDECGGWWSTLLATLIGTGFGAAAAAVVGVLLFYYTGSKTQENRVRDLREALIAELQATTDRLKTTEESTTLVQDPIGGGGPVVRVVLAHLTPTASEEAIRSALFSHENTVRLTRLTRLMREYTTASQLLNSLLANPRMDPRSLGRIYELEERKGV